MKRPRFELRMTWSWISLQSRAPWSHWFASLLGSLVSCARGCRGIVGSLEFSIGCHNLPSLSLIQTHAIMVFDFLNIKFGYMPSIYATLQDQDLNTHDLSVKSLFMLV